MKDSIREITQIPELTMGLDLGDKFSYYCIIDKSGKSVEAGAGENTSSTHHPGSGQFSKHEILSTKSETGSMNSRKHDCAKARIRSRRSRSTSP